MKHIIGIALVGLVACGGGQDGGTDATDVLQPDLGTDTAQDIPDLPEETGEDITESPDPGTEAEDLLAENGKEDVTPPCQTDEDCDDLNKWTIDTCMPEGCVNAPDPENPYKCETDEDCWFPSSVCCNSYCHPEAKVCFPGPLMPGSKCCADDAHCAGGGPECTFGKCITGVMVMYPAICNSGCDYFTEWQPVECDDDNACTFFEYCEDGVCMHGETIDCDDGNPCTNDSCDPEDWDGAPCQHEAIPNCLWCLGGLYGQINCNQAPQNPDPACLDGLCLESPDGGIVTCSPSKECEKGVCVEGVCITSECVFFDTVCNDGDHCTEDTCDSKWSLDGTSSGCHSENLYCPGCAEVSECLDDDNPCTEQACDQYCRYPIKFCDDMNATTLDYCDTATGECLHVAIPASPCAADGDCVDQNQCTVNEHCHFDSGLGIQYCVWDAVACDDGMGCTIDLCDPNLGCVFTDIPDCPEAP